MKAAKLGDDDEVTDLSDRISSLPNDLLIRILSLIPVRNAIATSLLSKRWTTVWKMMPNLVYEETHPNISHLRFEHFCNTSLKLHESLKTLILILRNRSVSIDTLVFPNLRSDLHEIAVVCTSYPLRESSITFPEVFKTLVVLNLKGTIYLDVAGSPVCFPSLKTLSLECVKFESEDSFRVMLSACPVLEDLFLQRLKSVGRFSFTISVPSLQRLVVDTERAYYSSDEATLEITAPSLKYLKIFDRVGVYNFMVDMPKLVEADVSVNMSENEKLLNSFTSVECLSIDLYPSKDLALTERFISKTLVSLEIDTCYIFRANLIFFMLKDLPNLRALKLDSRHLEDTEDRIGLFSGPSSVRECLSFNLETLEWIGYKGTYEENETAGYLLRNAPCLKKATVTLHSRGMVENDHLMMKKELESMVKASTSCQLLVEF